jgi:SAM-dependent methyltransferase
VIAEFDDPRLVALYNSVNAYGPGEQPDFYAQVAAESGAHSILDLGCGTGLLTRALADRGYELIAVEPSTEMLAVARATPGGEQVRWIHGDATTLAPAVADLAIMTGHVAQFFVTDEGWRAALSGLHGAVRAGGLLAFESRNPDARAWESWTRTAVRTCTDPTVGRIETWTDVTDERDGIVSYLNHYVVTGSGEDLVSAAQLRFRSRAELTDTLAEAGFTVEHVYGDWDRRPVSPHAPELIFVARRD